MRRRKRRGPLPELHLSLEAPEGFSDLDEELKLVLVCEALARAFPELPAFRAVCIPRAQGGVLDLVLRAPVFPEETCLDQRDDEVLAHLADLLASADSKQRGLPLRGR